MYPPDKNPPVNTGNIVYPTNHMRQVASTIMKDASDAQQQHDIEVAQLLNFVYSNFDESMQSAISDLIHAYTNRMRASYDWQMDLATALHSAVDAITENETSTTTSFQNNTSNPS